MKIRSFVVALVCTLALTFFIGAPLSVWSASPLQSQSSTASVKLATVQDNANLRAGPGKSYAIVGHVKTGQQVKIIGANGQGDWYQLDTNQWIAAFLVNIISDAPAVTPAPQVNQSITSTHKIVTVIDNANLRGGPGTSYPVTGSVATNQTLEVVGQNSDDTWYQLSNGAWIAAFLVTTQPASSADTASTSEQVVQPTNTPTPTSIPIPTNPVAPTANPLSGQRYGAICRDGTQSGATGRGACSHHGGVDHWLVYP